MEKRSADERDSERIVIKLVTDIGKGVEPGTPQQPKTVRLRLMKEMKLIATGKHTGRVYEFNRAGAEADVNYEDAQTLLQMRRKPCRSCPSVGSSPYFELVGG